MELCRGILAEDRLNAGFACVNLSCWISISPEEVNCVDLRCFSKHFVN